MKKNLCYALMMLFVSMTVLTACGSDDDALPIETEVAGMYKGTLDIDLGGTNIGSNIPKNILITKASENKINLELKDFSFGGMNLGTIAIPNCDVKASGKTYTFTGAQTLTLQAPIGNCPVAVTGSLLDGVTTLNLDITVSSLNQKVKVVYKGKRLSGNENGDAKITAFTFASSVVTEQPFIDEVAGIVTFKVDASATADQLKALVPTITLSDKAKVSPATGVAQDFSGGKVVTYTVVAENGTVKEYKVSVKGTTTFYGFEEWGYETEPYDDVDLAIGWASCNSAVALIKNMGPMGGITYEGLYPVRSTTDCVSGKYAALLESVDTKGGTLFEQKVPKVTAGSMFLGVFNPFAAMQNPMATTSFGIKYDKKPLVIKGSFKYTAGKDYYDANGALNISKKDECSMAAVLYEIAKDDDTLDGSNIYVSDKIIASAMFTNGGTKAFTPFELKLNYTKAYDATKKYKLAIIFSASKDGASYNAAIGSKLIIDNVAIINE